MGRTRASKSPSFLVRENSGMREDRGLVSGIGSMTSYPAARIGGVVGRSRVWYVFALLVALVAVVSWSRPLFAQENPLGNVQTPAPPPQPKSPEDQKPVIEGSEDVVRNATSHKEARLRVNVNLVQ